MVAVRTTSRAMPAGRLIVVPGLCDRAGRDQLLLRCDGARVAVARPTRGEPPRVQPHARGSRPRRPLPALPDSLAPDGATAPCPPPRLGPDARDVRPDVRRAVAVWGSKSWVHAAARYWWMSPPSRSWRSPASRDPPSPGCRRPTQRSPPRTTPTAQDELLCPATQSRHLPRQ